MVNRRHWYRHRLPPGTQVACAASRRGVQAGRIGVDPGGGPRSAAPTRAGLRPTQRRGKRILFINQYYWPDHASTAQHLTDLAESLAGRGLRVPRPLRSQGRYKPGEPRPPAYEVHEGVHIHRVPATSLGRRGTWARMTDYLSFYAGAWSRPCSCRASTWS